MRMNSVAALMSLCCLAPLSTAETYLIQQLPLLPGSFVASAGVKLTDAGAVVGYCERSDGTRERFLWLPAAMHGRAAGVHSLGEVASFTGEANAINLNGVWAGGEIFSGSGLAYTWTPAGGQVFLDPIGTATRASAFDLNKFRVAAGWSRTGQIDAGGTEGYRGVAWDADGDAFILQPVTGSLRSRADGINDAGVVVGSSGDLDYLVYAVNRLWQPAVGTDELATIWRHGVPINLNELLANDTGWVLEAATDINNYGQIVGIGLSPTGQRRAFLLTPAGDDYNGDEVIDNQDLLDFLSDYAANHPAADFTGDSNVNPDDFEAFLDGGYDVEPDADALAWEANGCEFLAVMVVTDASTANETQSNLCVEDLTYQEWIACGPPCWNKWHPDFNPNCHGCGGNTYKNPGPDGNDGWPGDAEYNPYHPDGGPGGPGDDNGDGGNGGNGTQDPDGEGGNGGDGGPGGKEGDGGHGGDGYRGNPQGGNGGNGGPGGPDGGSGGNGGLGGDGLSNDSPGGKGGNGGHGADGTTNPGGSGGSGGDGGTGAGTGVGGEGGLGGNGGKGSNSGNGTTGKGGSGGSGGEGGDGGLHNGNGGAGGGGGNAGPGGDSGGNGGNGGEGGSGGETGPGSGTTGGKGGNGGNGAAGGGGTLGGNGGSGGGGGKGGEGNGGTGGNGGNGGNGGGPGSGNSSHGSGGLGGQPGGGQSSGTQGGNGTPPP